MNITSNFTLKTNDASDTTIGSTSRLMPTTNRNLYVKLKKTNISKNTDPYNKYSSETS